MIAGGRRSHLGRLAVRAGSMANPVAAGMEAEWTQSAVELRPRRWYGKAAVKERAGYWSPGRGLPDLLTDAATASRAVRAATTSWDRADRRSDSAGTWPSPGRHLRVGSPTVASGSCFLSSVCPFFCFFFYSDDPTDRRDSLTSTRIHSPCRKILRW